MAADPDAVKALGATDLFSSLSKSSLDAIAASARTVEHPAGKTITTEGDAGVGFHLITEGRAVVAVGGSQRAEIGPGKYFGEISLIDSGPRTATVTAKTDVTTISLAAWDFRPILESEPDIARALLLVMCKRLRAAEAR
jgi:CRP/FNR family transcriptional regulator, cyclic AMP receptor protein